jgi:hypothetical protein
MRRKRKVINWFKVSQVSILLGLSFFVGSCFIRDKQHFPAESEIIKYTYQVSAGDTIWDVASNVATPNEDVRELVYNIIETNKIDNPACLQEGQTIYIFLKRAK